MFVILSAPFRPSRLGWDYYNFGQGDAGVSDREWFRPLTKLDVPRRFQQTRIQSVLTDKSAKVYVPLVLWTQQTIQK